MDNTPTEITIIKGATTRKFKVPFSYYVQMITNLEKMDGQMKYPPLVPKRTI